MTRPGAAPEILVNMEPLERLRSAGKRVTDPLESLAQRVAERVIDLVVHALDVNVLLEQVDLNALLARVDVDQLLDRVDLTALLERVDITAVLDRVDVNALIQRIDVEALVTHTDFGEIIAKSSSGVASHALDAVRGQTVNLDGAIDRGVWRLVRRNAARPAGPPALLRPPAES
jgi:hypothetical protein